MSKADLNDGIALPPILACIAALSAEATEKSGFQYWMGFTLKQFLFGPLLGALVGWLGGVLVDKTSKKGWMNPTFQRLAAWSLAVLAYALAEKFHGNGFIAAFFGGLMLGVHTPAVRERIQEFGEAEGQQLGLLVFLIFGLAAGDKVLGRQSMGVCHPESDCHPHASGCREPDGDKADKVLDRFYRMVRPAWNCIGAVSAHRRQRTRFGGA